MGASGTRRRSVGCFRFDECSVAGELVADVECAVAGFEGEVGPAQSEEFADAQEGVDGDGEKEGVVLFGVAFLGELRGGGEGGV